MWIQSAQWQEGTWGKVGTRLWCLSQRYSWKHFSCWSKTANPPSLKVVLHSIRRWLLAVRDWVPEKSKPPGHCLQPSFPEHMSSAGSCDIAWFGFSFYQPASLRVWSWSTIPPMVSFWNTHHHSFPWYLAKDSWDG
jgi:hypothetical protein